MKRVRKDTNISVSCRNAARWERNWSKQTPSVITMYYEKTFRASPSSPSDV